MLKLFLYVKTAGSVSSFQATGGEGDGDRIKADKKAGTYKGFIGGTKRNRRETEAHFYSRGSCSATKETSPKKAKWPRKTPQLQREALR